MAEHHHRPDQAELFWSQCHGIVARTCAALAQAWLQPGAAVPADAQRQQIGSLLWVLDKAIEAHSAGPVVEYAARLGHDCARAGRGLDEPVAVLALVAAHLRAQLGSAAGPARCRPHSYPLDRLFHVASRAMTEAYVAAVCDGQRERARRRPGR